VKPAPLTAAFGLSIPFTAEEIAAAPVASLLFMAIGNEEGDPIADLLSLAVDDLTFLAVSGDAEMPASHDTVERAICRLGHRLVVARELYRRLREAPTAPPAAGGTP
jgi:hypothetical protein